VKERDTHREREIQKEGRKKRERECTNRPRVLLEPASHNAQCNVCRIDNGVAENTGGNAAEALKKDAKKADQQTTMGFG